VYIACDEIKLDVHCGAPDAVDIAKTVPFQAMKYTTVDPLNAGGSILSPNSKWDHTSSPLLRDRATTLGWNRR
jgi:hypothetical protein